MFHRILMIAPTSFFSDYGCHIRIWQEATALQARGHQLVIATYHNGDDMPGLAIRRSWDVPWLKRAVVGSSRHKMYLDVALSYRALETMLRFRPTMLHAHLHEGALIGAVLRRMSGLPLVFDFQGSLTAEMLDHHFLKSRDSRLYPWLRELERRLNLEADALITSSQNATDLLIREFAVPEDRVTTIGDGINVDRFQPFDDTPAWQAERQQLRESLGIPPDRKVVVYLGLLAPHQGINLLMESARMLLEQRHDVHFLIMGFPGVDAYAALADSLGIAGHVSLPGRIMYRDSAAYLALGDVAVAPKMSATEGSGKIPQYMAMGLPVVTFDTPVSREYLGEYGFYARFGDGAHLAERLLDALGNPEHARRIGNLGREKAVREHASDLAAPQIEAVYARAQVRRRAQGSEGYAHNPDTPPGL